MNGSLRKTYFKKRYIKKERKKKIHSFSVALLTKDDKKPKSEHKTLLQGKSPGLLWIFMIIFYSVYLFVGNVNTMAFDNFSTFMGN